jgi:predicted nicotinamide N-methyase
MSQPRVSELVAVQQKIYVTYTFPSETGDDERAITLLESPALLAVSANTGKRTWESALHMSKFLSEKGSDIVDGKSVLELGSGTGLVAALCAKHLYPKFVLATDGDPEVVQTLEDNMFYNGLVKQDLIQCRVLRWGRTMDEDESGEYKHFDTMLGADLVRNRTT